MTALRRGPARLCGLLCLGLLAPLAWPGEPERTPAPPEIRVLDHEGRVLLSRGGVPLAVAQLRPVSAAGNAPQGVLEPAAAHAALQSAGKALKDGGEQVREFTYPLPAGRPDDTLTVVLRTRRVAAGARLLVTGFVSGPMRDDLAPGEQLPAPPALEMALQLFPDAENKPPRHTFSDRRQVPPLLEKDAPAAAESFRARSFTFEGAQGYRVDSARSAPANWTLRPLPENQGLLLTAPLLPHPRETGSVGSFVLYLGAGSDDAPPEASAVTLERAQVPARELLEGAVRVYASGSDPYVLAETVVVAEIAFPPRPDGEVPLVRLPCFFWEAPRKTPAEGEFRFRFAPPAEGVYGVRISVAAPTGQLRGDALPLRAGPPVSAGSVRVMPGESRFTLDDGSVFFPLGLTLPVGTPLDQPEYFRRVFRELLRRGGNTLRLPAGDFLEQAEAGRFDPDAAENLDRIMRAAQARDIHVILSTENAADIGAGSRNHPYFREKGGPLAATPEFFRNPAVKRLFENRLTYLAARYGAYRALFSWELLSSADDCWQALKEDPDDPHLPPGEADLARRARRDVQDWAAAMALHLKGMDQHGHLICISTRLAGGKPWAELEKAEHLDWSLCLGQDPAGNADAKTADITGALLALAQAAREPGRAHRPLVVTALFPDALKGPGGSEFLQHDALFASLASGLAGGPLEMLAAPDSPEAAAALDVLTPAALYASALREVSRCEGRDELRTLNETASAGGVPLRETGRYGLRGLALWLQDKRAAPGAANPEVPGVDLTLPALQEGAYAVVYLDPWRGVPIRQETYNAPARKVEVPALPVRLRTPPFRRDLVVVLTPVR